MTVYLSSIFPFPLFGGPRFRLRLRPTLRRALCHHVHGALEASPCVGIKSWLFVRIEFRHGHTEANPSSSPLSRLARPLVGELTHGRGQRWAFITGVAHHDDRDLFWWIGLSIVVAVAANTRGRSPIAWFIYAIIFSPLLSGLLLLALPNLANSFAAGRMYLEGELRELEERRRRRAIVARIAAVVVVLMGIVAWMMLA